MWEKGLGEEVVEERIVRFGLNEITGKKRFLVLRLIARQWKSPLIWLLAIAAAVTYLFGDWVDMWMILATVILNTVLGFVQEYRVEKSLDALKSVLAPRAEVIRDGERLLVEASRVVPGDILFVSNAHKVAADGLVLSTDGLFTSEAILTGESRTVEKQVWKETQGWSDNEQLAKLRGIYSEIGDQHKVFMGTEVRSGAGHVLVLKTGMETEIGKISGSLRGTEEGKTPLQKKIARLTAWLAGGAIVVASVVVVTGVISGKSAVEVLPLAVALAVAALPEGLSLSLTVILAIGMKRILGKGGVVRHLAAAEALGSVGVICADKTGTLTKGEMTVTQGVTNVNDEGDRQATERLVIDAVLCNDMRDPLEIAMKEWADKQLKNWGNGGVIDGWKRVDSKPFTSKEKLIMTLLERDSERLLIVSGAPEVVLARTKLSQTEQQDWEKKFKELAIKGYRLVGFARKSVDKKTKEIGDKDSIGMEWDGILVYEDPIRKGVSEALERVRRAGIEVKVITGDYRETAMAILNQLGLLGVDDLDKTVTGEEMSRWTVEELAEKIGGIVLFARTNPEEKLRIVEALQKKRMIVAMTGDGVNDAPALKKADLGIVVNEATEVAKEAADLVLVKNDFSTIVDAIEEGRNIGANFRKVVTYLLADAFAGILVIIGSLFLGWPLPLLASQILWINLISDGFPYLALTLELKEDGLLNGSPKRFAGAILSSTMLRVMLTISILAGGATLGVFGWYWMGRGDLSMARTMAMVMLGANSLFYVFSTRSLERPIWEGGGKNNWWLWLGVGLGWLVLLSAVYWPALAGVFGNQQIGLLDWRWVVSGTILVIAGAEIVKVMWPHRG